MWSGTAGHESTMRAGLGKICEVLWASRWVSWQHSMT